MENFIEELIKDSTDYQNTIDPKYRKNNGIYYTDFKLASYLIDEFFEYNKDLYNKDIRKKTFFEPCVGIGIFVFAFLEKISLILSKKEMIEMLHNIYVADIDDNALKSFGNKLSKYYKEKYDYNINLVEFLKTNSTNHLLFSQRKNEFKYYKHTDSFPINGFDIVITNPPYKNLKAEKDKFINEDEYIEEKSYYELISKFVKKNFHYSTSGVLNIYKLFVEEIMVSYSKENSNIILLIPSTILSDKSCNDLRTLIFEKSTVSSVNCIEENNKIFDGTQAMCSILLRKGGLTKSFRIDPKFEINAKHNYQQIDYKINNNTSNSIAVLNDSEKELLRKLSIHKKLKEIDFISNKRGELDITANSSSIVSYKTSFPFLRGRNIGEYILKEVGPDFVADDFIQKSTKSFYVKRFRIACQQISNMNKEKRLVFSLIPPNYVLGNSCNFISCLENNYTIDIYYLLALMNCPIMNWYFKLTSSNNHVNNYEIDEFPIPLEPKEKIQSISNLTKQYIQNRDSNLLTKINNACSEILLGTKDQKIGKGTKKTTMNITSKFQKDFKDLTGFDILSSDAEKLIKGEIKLTDLSVIISKNNDDFIQKCIKALVEKYQKLFKYKILNHTPFKLSELDLEMIKCVPQGGNWKNIKQEVINKSKRLLRIQQTGGRTTLYGRIDYSKPSYTITTYFNRPGNGTYVHPVHERVISPREAARFQSFDDDYYFYGSKNDLLDQIGNAVPPILAQAIAKKILSKINIKNSIDLFAGAGGITSGFTHAGIVSKCAVDFIENACITLKINEPKINVIVGDLTLDETKEKIYRCVEKDRIDLICGGPPCQGFSLAGKRFVDDPRNKLFKEYLDILTHLMPKVFVMENVDGMKSMQGGKVYDEIIKSFTEAGYNVTSSFLFANEYEVPQKRKRLIIIGTRKDLNIDPKSLYPETSKKEITAEMAIKDLENIPCSADATYDESIEKSEYVKFLRRNID